jgi:Ca-activated chloride channel homolog
MMPLMSLTSLLNILRPNRAPAAGAPGDDNVYMDTSGANDEPSAGNGSGGYLVARDGRTMPLRGVSLRADARGGIARVVLEQRFVNPYQEPLHVTYLLPLPAEAAVSGYAFVLEGRRIVGEVDRKQKARQRFERAILEGKTAGIVEQERSSLFTQELGNVPAGADVIAELTIDQRLIWKHEGAWEWRFPTAVGPRYVGAPGQVADAAKLAVAVAEGGTPARLALALAIRDALPGSARPESPSHRLRSSAAGSCLDVQLASEDGARLDRDVVVRWPVASGGVGTALDVGRPHGQRDSYGLLTLVPPEPSRQRASRRDLILLLDTSGSMDGDPLRQLKRTSLALIDSLTDRDTLEMIEFSSSARRWHRGAKEATSSVKREARGWINGLRAGGGTEMVSGMLEALAPLTERSQRQVVLLTDGYIGQEREVITQVMQKLPRGSCRVHVVGVGSSVNRTLTAGVARAGAGVELILAPGEDAERLVGGLLARTAAPLVTHVEVRGEAILANAPAYLPDLYAGSPALISLQLRPEGGQLELSGHTADGPWRQVIAVPACGEGQGTAALAALFARETVEDLELAHATTLTDHAAIDRAIEDLGLRYQIATRLTTWVAVSQEATVDPSRPSRREVVAHEVPQGVSVSGLGLRAAQPSPGQAPMAAEPMGGPRAAAGFARYSVSSGKAAMMPTDRSAEIRHRSVSSAASGYAPPPPPSASAPMAARPPSAPAQLEADDDDVAFLGGVMADLEAVESLSAPQDAEADEWPSGPPPDSAPMPTPVMPSSPQPRSMPMRPASVVLPSEPAGRAKDSEKKEAAPRQEQAKADESRVARVSKARAASPSAQSPMAKAPAPLAMLRAKLRHRDEGLLSLEIELHGELAWSAGATVVVHLAGGRQVTARVLPQTTGAGTYGQGQLLRLVIDLGAAEAEAQPIAVLVAGRLIPIVMD